MAVLAYNQITPKTAIIYNDEPYVVLSHHVFRKQKRKPVNITKLKNLKNGKVIEQTFHQNETVEEADLETREITFIFKKPNEYWFHSAGKPSDRFPLPESLIGQSGRFIKEKSNLSALVFDDEIIAIRMPIKVELLVTEAMDAVKGNTASGAQKEVTLETGTTLMVPMFIQSGDVVTVNTETGLYAERANKS